MPVIHVNVGDNYSEDLKRRLQELDISYGELARVMTANAVAKGEKVAYSTQQISRWMNRKTAEGKLMQPRMDNIRRIEEAILSIRRQRQGKSSRK